MQIFALIKRLFNFSKIRTLDLYQLISRNNQGPVQPILKHTNIVHQYTCPHEDSALQKQQYIGHSVTTLSRRLTMHLNNGGPLQHATTVHNQKLTRENLVNNTIIIHHEIFFKKLNILEALAIKNSNPSINSQRTGSDRILQLFH